MSLGGVRQHPHHVAGVVVGVDGVRPGFERQPAVLLDVVLEHAGVGDEALLVQPGAHRFERVALDHRNCSASPSAPGGLTSRRYHRPTQPATITAAISTTTTPNAMRGRTPAALRRISTESK